MEGQGLASGTRLGGYVLEKLLGRGGMGFVYQARDERLRRAVAIKVISPAFSADARFMGRFEREARAGAAIVHANVTSVFAIEQAGPVTFIVFELVTGGSLRDLQKHAGALDWRRAVGMASGIAKGLGAVHAAGLVHRDLKPENVLLDAQGQPKLADFGLVGRSGKLDATVVDKNVTRDGEVLGTPSYMSPEQADGREAGFRSDLYSLGALLYTLLTDQPIFSGNGVTLITKHLLETPRPPSAIVATVPPEVEKLVMRLLEKEPEKRGESANAVAAELEALLHPAAPPPAKAPASRAPIVAAVLAVLALAVVALILHASSGPTSPSPEAHAPPPDAPSPSPSDPGTVPSASQPAAAQPETSPPEAGTDKTGGNSPETAHGSSGSNGSTSGSGTATSTGATGTPSTGSPGVPLETPAAGIRVTGSWMAASWQLSSCTIPAIAFAPDGQRFVFNEIKSNKSPTVKLWDPATSSSKSNDRWDGELLFDVLPAGDRVLLVGEGGVWQWAFVKDVAASFPKGSGGKPVGAAVSADGTRALVSRDDGTLDLVDLTHPSPVTAGSLQASGKRTRVAFVGKDHALTGDELGSLHLVDLATGNTTDFRPTSSSEDAVLGLSVDKEGKRAISAHALGSVVLWDLASGTSRPIGAHTADALRAAFLPGDRLAVTSGADGTVRLWDLSANDQAAPLAVFSGFSGNPVRGLAVSTQGSVLASDMAGNLRLWDRAGRHAVLSLAVARDGRVLSGGTDGLLRVWHPDGQCTLVLSERKSDEQKERGKKGEKNEAKLEEGPRDPITLLGFSGQDEQEAGGVYLGHVALWSLQGEGERIGVVKLENVSSGAFLGNGCVVAGSPDLACVELDDKKLDKKHLPMLPALRPSGTQPDLVAASPDRKHLLLAPLESATGTLTLLDVGGASRPLGEPLASPVHALAFSANGTCAASGDAKGEVAIWDVAAGKRSATLHPGSDMHALAFSRDGASLLTASQDGTVRLWDLASGKETSVLDLRPLGDVPECLALAPDGHAFYVGTQGGLILSCTSGR